MTDRAHGCVRRWLGWSLLLLEVGSGCFPELPSSMDEVENAGLFRTPSGLIPVDGDVFIDWDTKLSLVDNPLVWGPHGRLAASIDAKPGGLKLSPQPQWPPRTRVIVDLSDRLEAEDGLLRGELVVEFQTESATSSSDSLSTIVVRRPVPGRFAPSNIRWMSVAGVPPSIQVLGLRREDGQELWASRAQRDGDLGVFVLKSASGDTCGTQIRSTNAEFACGQSIYQLVEPPEVKPGVLSQIRTSSVPDLRPPRFEKLDVSVLPGALVVDVRVNEMARVQGDWFSDENEGRLRSLTEPGQRLRLQHEGAFLPTGRRLEIHLKAEDLAGHMTSTVCFAATPPQVHIQMTEVVPTPRSDWGDSEEEGEPFDPWPGKGTVSSADEWLELVHQGSSILDVRSLGLEVRAIDGSPSVTVIASVDNLRFGDGGGIESWYPGEALVVPIRGDMAQRDLTLELWAGAILLDTLRMGTELGAQHPGGPPPNLTHEALARGRDGRWRWCRPSPGDPVPSTDCI